jgi:hypothetical protein
MEGECKIHLNGAQCNNTLLRMQSIRSPCCTGLHDICMQVECIGKVILVVWTGTILYLECFATVTILSFECFAIVTILYFECFAFEEPMLRMGWFVNWIQN